MGRVKKLFHNLMYRMLRNLQLYQRFLSMIRCYLKTVRQIFFLYNNNTCDGAEYNTFTTIAHNFFLEKKKEIIHTAKNNPTS